MDGMGIHISSPSLLVLLYVFLSLYTESVLPQLVCGAHLSHLQLAILHAAAGAAQMHVEVHAVDAGAGVVLDAQVNVLLRLTKNMHFMQRTNHLGANLL